MKNIGEAILTLLMAIIGVAVLSVILGSSNTTSVLSTTFNGLAQLLNAATAPAMGNTSSSNSGSNTVQTGLNLLGIGTGTGIGVNGPTGVG